jgi:hypothetical protein
VVLSLTAILFGIVPSETTKLQRAIDEAEQISQLDFPQLFTTAVADNAEIGPYARKIAHILSGAGIECKLAVYQVLWGEACFQLPPSSAKLQQLQDYILDPKAATVVLPIIPDSSLDHLKDKVLESRPYSAKLAHLEVVGAGDETRVRLQFYGGSGNFDVSLPYAWNSAKVDVRASLVDLMAGDARVRELVRLTSDGEPILFPQLQQYWPEVRDLTPRQVTRDLATRKAFTGDKIEFLGFSIPTYLAGIAVPLAVLILLLHLLIYVDRLLQLLIAGGDTQACELDFPWLPLLQDRVSPALTLLSFLGLPVAANFVIACKSFGRTSAWAFLVVIALAIAAVTLCVWLYLKRIWGLRRPGPSRPPAGR